MSSLYHSRPLADAMGMLLFIDFLCTLFAAHVCEQLQSIQHAGIGIHRNCIAHTDGSWRGPKTGRKP